MVPGIKQTCLGNGYIRISTGAHIGALSNNKNTHIINMSYSEIPDEITSDIDTIYNEGHAGSNVVFHPHHWRALKKSGMDPNTRL